MIIKNALVYRNGTRSFEKLDIEIKDGKITDLMEKLDGDDFIDLSGFAVVPGLVDVHTHGRSGFDFVNAASDNLSIMAKDYARHGVTSVMPTVASAPLDVMLSAADRINKFCPGDAEADFCGVHLEGRYLNMKYKGAHAERYIAELNPDELDNEILKSCRYLQISAAYELDKKREFANKALQIGATLSLGHTSASYEEARIAEEHGVSAYTHLFNAMPPLHHREGGTVCRALTGDKFAEIICDGIHIAPEMVRFAYSCLTNKRMTLISDSMEATGCADGEYSIAGMPVTVKDGMARTPRGVIAGSTLTLDAAVRNLMEFCKIPLSEAIICATENPAKQIGAFSKIGSIDIGKSADMLVISNTESFEIEKVFVRGHCLPATEDGEMPKNFLKLRLK